MIFDVDVKLIKTLAREQKIGARDAIIKPVQLGHDSGTFVGAKTMRAVDFLKFLEKKLPKIDVDVGRSEEEEDVDVDELDDEEDLEDSEDDEDLGDDLDDEEDADD